ncbi:MAG: hypothetical protein JWO52_4058 [Gammaproteobacteria bacterium]|jgi:hypothetical protein|nr:hypothetical protein [Gammaproteobacteria bacterium]
MSNNAWHQLLARSRTSGTALTNTTTATSVLPAAERFNIPSNLWEVGSRFRVRLGGKLSTAASTPGTLTLDCRVGSVVVFTAATPTLATSASNLTWIADINLTAQSVGSGTGTTLMGLGEIRSLALSATIPWVALPASSPAVGTGFDNTVSGFFDVFATWSVASASNVIQVNDYEFSFLN